MVKIVDSPARSPTSRPAWDESLVLLEGPNSVRKMPQIKDRKTTASRLPIQQVALVRTTDDRGTSAYVSQNQFETTKDLNVQQTMISEPHTAWAGRLPHRSYTGDEKGPAEAYVELGVCDSLQARKTNDNMKGQSPYRVQQRTSSLPFPEISYSPTNVKNTLLEVDTAAGFYPHPNKKLIDFEYSNHCWESPLGRQERLSVANQIELLRDINPRSPNGAYTNGQLAGKQRSVDYHHDKWRYYRGESAKERVWLGAHYPRPEGPMHRALSCGDRTPWLSCPSPGMQGITSPSSPVRSQYQNHHERLNGLPLSP